MAWDPLLQFLCTHACGANPRVHFIELPVYYAVLQVAYHGGR